MGNAASTPSQEPLQQPQPQPPPQQSSAHHGARGPGYPLPGMPAVFASATQSGSAAQPVPAQPAPTKPTPGPGQQHRQLYTHQPPDQQSRILVDIRGAPPNQDYNIWVKQETRREIEAGVRTVSSTLQALGGILITVLTIQKLFEDVRFVRLLRRELSGLVGALTDRDGPRGGRGGGADDAAAAAQPGKPRPSTPGLDLSGLGAEATDEAKDGAAPAETTWSAISGLTEVKMLLQEATVLPTLRPDLFQGIRQPPRALLLFGPPGTGKTMLARAVATESRASFMAVTGSSVLSMWYGQSEQNVRALFEKARKQQPAVIFIDEVDSLLGKRGSGGGGPRDSSSTPDKRVTNEFLAFIDGIQTGAGDGRITVIAATNSPWDLDEAALSRFARRIYVPLPDRATRAALIQRAMQGVPCAIAGDEWQALADRCELYSGRDLVAVCREASMRPLRELWGRRLLESTKPVPPPCTAASAAAAGGQGTGTTADGGAAAAHAAARQRLVELVAKSLAAAAPSPPAEGQGQPGRSGERRRWWGGLRSWRGGSRYARCRQQARRELERWKRAHGADWCDVGGVVEAAEQLLAARAAEKAAVAAAKVQAEGLAKAQAQGQSTAPALAAAAQGGGAEQAAKAQPGARPGGPEVAAQGQGAEAAQGTVQPERQAGRQSGAEDALGGGRCGAESACGDAQARHRSSGGGAKGLRVGRRTRKEGQPSPPGSAQQAQQQRPASPPAQASCSDAPAAAASPTGAAACCEGGGDGSATSRASEEQQQPAPSAPCPSGPGTGCGGAAAASGDVAGGVEARAGDAGAGGGDRDGYEDEYAGGSAVGPGTPSPEAEQGAGLAADAATGGDAGEAGTVAPAPATLAASVPAAAAATGSVPAEGAAPAAAAAATSAPGGSAADDDAWTVDKLLSLPATTVRPVARADFEAALATMSHTEFDASAKYGEWDEQYGSGAGGTRGGGRLGGARKWMSMYA